MNTETLTTTQLETVISNYLYLHENKLIRPSFGTNSADLLNWVLECARELEFRQEDTDYLTRDQVADLLGNDAYIHVSDYEDLEAVSYSMMHPTPVGNYEGADVILR